MAYFMRYVSSDPQPLGLQQIADAVQAAGEAYSSSLSETSALLKYQGRDFGLTEIRLPGDIRFTADIARLVSAAKTSNDVARDRVIAELERATLVVSMQVLSGTADDAALDDLAPFWRTLSSGRVGLMQADGEGFFDQNGLVLETH